MKKLIVVLTGVVLLVGCGEEENTKETGVMTCGAYDVPMSSVDIYNRGQLDTVYAQDTFQLDYDTVTGAQLHTIIANCEGGE